MFTVYNLLSEDEADKMLTSLNRLDKWEEGQARTKELTGTVKQNLEIPRNDPHSQAASKVLIKNLRAIKEFSDYVFPHKIFSIKFNKYEGSGTYHRHTDAAFMGEVRTDYACTIFLTDPDTYEGGELCIEHPSGAVFKHKGKKGDCVIYPCGSPHWVAPVTEGVRISGITWIQSLYRDSRQRENIQILRKVEHALEEAAEMDNEECLYRQLMVDVCRVDGDLTKMWSDA